jgi:hypothetical protein
MNAPLTEYAMSRVIPCQIKQSCPPCRLKFLLRIRFRIFQVDIHEVNFSQIFNVYSDLIPRY